MRQIFYSLYVVSKRIRQVQNTRGVVPGLQVTIETLILPLLLYYCCLVRLKPVQPIKQRSILCPRENERLVVLQSVEMDERTPYVELGLF